MSTIERRRLAGATLAAAAIALAACSRASEPPKIPLNQAADASAEATPNPHDLLVPAARTALDSANASFRAGDYQAALTQYRSAAKAQPENVAPYYGVYMVAQKLGDKKLAASAMAEVQSRAKGSKLLTDTGVTKVHGK